MFYLRDFFLLAIYPPVFFSLYQHNLYFFSILWKTFQESLLCLIINVYMNYEGTQEI